MNEQVRRHGISHVIVHLPAPIKKAWCVEPARAQEEGSFVLCQSQLLHAYFKFPSDAFTMKILPTLHDWLSHKEIFLTNEAFKGYPANVMHLIATSFGKEAWLLQTSAGSPPACFSDVARAWGCEGSVDSPVSYLAHCGQH